MLKRAPFRPGHYKAPGPPNNNSDAQQPHRDRYDWITLWTAVIGVLIVAAGTGIAAYQSYLSRVGLVAAVSQQRAWLKLDLAPKTGLIVGAGGGEMAVDLTVTNVGNVPATFAKGEAALIATTVPGMAGAEMIDLVSCPRPFKGNWGTTVFPGEAVKLPFEIPVATRKNLERAAGRGKGVSFLVTGCVTYQNGSSAVPHQTGVAYLILDGPRGRGNNVFNIDGSAVQPEVLVFERFPLLNSAN